jgi:hypothetical protein
MHSCRLISRWLPLAFVGCLLAPFPGAALAAKAMPKKPAPPPSKPAGSATKPLPRPSSIPPGTGLRGEYFSRADFSKLALVRIDPVLDFAWSSTKMAPVIAESGLAVRWTGELLAPKTGALTLTLTTGGTASAYLGDRLLISALEDPTTPRDLTGTFQVQAGRRYSLVIEVAETQADFSLKMLWCTGTSAPAPLPPQYFYPTPGPAVALEAPRSNAAVMAPATITLTAHVMAEEKAPVVNKVEFYSGAERLGEVTAAPYTFVWKDVLPGLFAISARATDAAGRVGISRCVAMEVLAPGIGVRGEYFDAPDFTNRILVRRDPSINFAWGTGAPVPTIEPESFSIRWTGRVFVPVSGTYTFIRESDDGVRLWVNGQLLIDAWTAKTSTSQATIPLEAGRLYDVTLEYFENNNAATVKLSWIPPGGKREIIPEKFLFPPNGILGTILFDDQSALPKSSVYAITGLRSPERVGEVGAQDPAISADGRTIVFTSGRHASWDDPRTMKNTELYAMNRSGTDLRRITESSLEDHQAAISADGKRVAFVSNRDGNWEIYLVTLDAGRPKRLTRAPGADIRPAFSPDGTRVAFQSERDGRPEIYLINIDGTGEMRLTDTGGTNPAFSPDGTRILYCAPMDGTTELCTISTEGGGLVRVTNNRWEEADPVFSPDGGEIVFSSTRLGKTDLYLIDADGTRERRLTDWGHCFRPTWSW